MTLLIFIGCKSSGFLPTQKKDLAYEIIALENYGDSELFYKTIPYENLQYNDNFSMQEINQNNFNKSFFFERERYVDFDTIFSEEQQNAIDNKFKSLKIVPLKAKKLADPEILSKSRSSYNTFEENRKGSKRITFPFFQKGLNGSLYAFIYRGSDQGLLYIYKRVDGKWQEFAKVLIWIS